VEIPKLCYLTFVRYPQLVFPESPTPSPSLKNDHFEGWEQLSPDFA
jgi:hypothetical protein